MLILLILSILSNLIVLTSQKYEDYRIVDKYGNRLNYYSKLHYAIQSKKSGEFLSFNHQVFGTVDKKLDKLDPENWFTFANKNGKLSCLTQRAIRKADYCVVEEKEDSILMASPVVSHVISFQPHKSSWWKLFEFQYELYAEIKDFEYETKLEDILREEGRPDVITEQTIENDSPAKISQKVEYTYKTSSTFEVSHSETTKKLWKGFFKVGIKTKVSFTAKVPLVTEIEGSVETGYEGGFETIDETSKTNGSATKDTTEKTLKQEINVALDAYQSVKVTAYQVILNDVEWKYKAKMVVSGRGPSWINDGRIAPDVIRMLLQKQYQQFDMKELKVNKDSIEFEERSTMKASFGLKSFTKVKDLRTNQLIAVYSEGKPLEDHGHHEFY